VSETSVEVAGLLPTPRLLFCFLCLRPPLLCGRYASAGRSSSSVESTATETLTVLFLFVSKPGGAGDTLPLDAIDMADPGLESGA